jgi:hypothetical protein
MDIVLAAASQVPVSAARRTGPPAHTWRDVFTVRVDGWGVDVHVGVIFAVILAVLIALSVLAHRSAARWRLTQADFTFAGCATVTMCPTDDVVGLAHQAWVEITTRKAAIPLDEEYDVVIEVYDSWYELFQALRDLAKSVPTRGGLRKGGDEAQLVEVLTGSLNEGLRPHLTRWQAQFRRWFDEAQKRPENAGLSPQAIQRTYPQYDEMVAGVRAVNDGLIEFAEALRRLAHDRQKTPWWHFWSDRAPKQETTRGD